ncbi:MAG: GatB/YqeY domain-containing protein [Candidatus Omnitrophota bacterium]
MLFASSLEEKIKNDIIQSMKSKDVLRTSTLRMLNAAMKNLSIEKQKGLDDPDILKIISRQLKQHQDSIESFKKGNRPDLVEKEEKELEILKSYMPEELSEEEIKTVVQKAISDIGASSKADFGKVMKECMQRLGSQTDGKIVSKIAQGLLSG